jgi:hypothetical protein
VSGRSTIVGLVSLALVLIFTATAAATQPTIGYTIDGIVGTNGWYRGSTHGNDVILHWSVSLNATSTNCLPAITIPGPTSGTTQTCWAENSDGRTTAVTRVIKIDATPPTGLKATFARTPDYHGWYNRPVAIHWGGADATSGIARCSSLTYHGPDTGAATVSGGCTDKAGNSAVAAVHLAYDATPPVVRAVTERSTATGNFVSWASSSPSDRIIIRREIRGHRAHTTVFDGVAGTSTFADTTIRPGNEYIYSVRSIDEAGNASKVVHVAGFPTILRLAARTRYVVHAAPNPILRWGPVRGAGYYNLQLFRGSKRIYSVWPTRHQVGLPTGWRWSGRHFALTPGRYRWYVWAGFGDRKLARYRLVGSAKFTLPR